MKVDLATVAGNAVVATCMHAHTQRHTDTKTHPHTNTQREFPAPAPLGFAVAFSLSPSLPHSHTLTRSYTLSSTRSHTEQFDCSNKDAEATTEATKQRNRDLQC